MTGSIEDEALDLKTWFERLRLLVAGLGDGAGGPGRHIRKAYHLHCLAPQPLKALMTDTVDEDRLEAMLECGAYESAVISLIGTSGKVTVGRNDPSGSIELRLRVDPASPAAEPASESWPTAILEAWAASFLRLQPLAH